METAGLSTDTQMNNTGEEEISYSASTAIYIELAVTRLSSITEAYYM